MRAQSSGGQVLRKRSIVRYYENPGRCLYCAAVIDVLDGQKVSDVKRKKFCNQSHAAKYNNSRYLKRTRILASGICERCGCTVQYSGKKNGGYVKRRYCRECLLRVQIDQAQKLPGVVSAIYIGDRTKGDLCEAQVKYSNNITKHARKIYARSGKAKACAICGYGKHVDICHMKQIASFSDETLIREINAIENLVALCPNHHWEFDHEFFDIGRVLEMAE